MAEIGMAKSVWNAKIQLCWWHLKWAVRARLDKAKLSTTPYNARRANGEFKFINVEFRPFGRPDPKEYEGGVLDVNNSEAPQATLRPDPLRIRLLAPRPATKLEAVTDAHHSRLQENNTTAAAEESGGSEDELEGHRVFCPASLRGPIIALVENHFTAHPLIPSYCHPSPAGIREWAVKEMYEFCVSNNLAEVWAYLWENWYRRGRWELWARAEHPEIPRLKTTMMVESQ
jgi:hypothetical protein